MKTKLIITGLLAVIISSCDTPRYLPSSDEIDVSQYGSYIKVDITKNSWLKIKGEFIAIDSNKLIVLTETGDIKKIVIVPVNQISHFTLRYAQPKHYDWTIPIGILLPLIPFTDPDGGGIMPFHGFFAILSIPINLIVTISVTTAGEKAFEYSDKKMTYDKLKMFARFPQGIPPNIDMVSIK